jgi:hypothetical protein
MNNKEHIDFLLKEISKLTGPVITRNLFRGKFTINEIIGEGLLELQLVYTQLNLDGSEYTPNLSDALLRKRYHVEVTDNIIDFYNQFYQEIIRIMVLGQHKSGTGVISYYINNGLENEQA